MPEQKELERLFDAFLNEKVLRTCACRVAEFIHAISTSGIQSRGARESAEVADAAEMGATLLGALA